MEKVPAVYWLSGLTCTDDNFPGQSRGAALCGGTGSGAGHSRYQSAWRGSAGCPGPLRSGTGRGFLRQCDPAAMGAALPDVRLRDSRIAGAGRSGIAADSRSALDHRAFDGRTWGVDLRLERARNVSIGVGLRPICHPMASGWGQGCFKAYLGDDREAWAAYDSARLIEAGGAATHSPADRPGYCR
jgi:S-formylglutathione hydrolase